MDKLEDLIYELDVTMSKQIMLESELIDKLSEICSFQLIAFYQTQNGKLIVIDTLKHSIYVHEMYELYKKLNRTLTFEDIKENEMYF